MDEAIPVEAVVIDPERRGLGMRLKAARESKGFTQDAIAERFGVNKATVSAWETGRGVPDALRLRALARLYDVSSDALLWENSLTPEAMKLAAEFDSLNEAQRATWRLVWLGYVAGTSQGGEGLPMPPAHLPAESTRRQ